MEQLDEDLKSTLEQAQKAESLTITMIDFIHKFEPIFVQR